ncbi:hypothetical protein LPUS_11260 [Lasallia pustulata]|uniref:Rhodopsin domain-containing protein n=1 Tax=Lasallia pustulata TaxID=136370 RepID=A0A1W5DBC7_9LECA|nr:hypothetical protein LPUS_11260 [Lasallia pustulata]
MATQTTTLTPEQSMVALQALLNGPAMPPPPGVTPNFDHPLSAYPAQIVPLTLFITIATIAVLMRMYTKLFLVRSVVLEDYAVLIGWAGEVAQVGTSVLSNKVCIGFHMWDVRLKDFFKLIYFIEVASIVYGPTLFFVKLSILLQYLRVFVPTRRGDMAMFVEVHVCIWSCFFFYLVTTFLLIFLCKPREKLWNPMLPGHCINLDAIYQITGIFNVVSDFTIMLLPVPPLWKLQLPLKRKCGVVAIFATGFFACVTSIARVAYTWKFANDADVSYNAGKMGLWAEAEMVAGIIVSCMPVFPRFFQAIAPNPQAVSALRVQARTAVDQRSAPSRASDTTPVPSMYDRPFFRPGGVDSSSKSWNDVYDPQTELRREYISLTEFDTASSKGEEGGDRRAGHSVGGPAPRVEGEV